MLTVYDLRNKAAPIINHGEISVNEKVNAVAQLDVVVYDFKENDVSYQMLQERSVLELPDNGQRYRVLNRSEDSLGDVKEKTITAFHVLHDLGDRNIHPAAKKNDNPDKSNSSNTAETSTGHAVGTVNTVEEGGAPLYISPVGGQPNGNRLENGTDWKIDKQVTVNNVKWYRVATGGWISEDYVSFDKDGDIKPEIPTITEVLGQGTIKASDHGSDTTNEDGTTTEHEAPTSADIYDSPFSGQNKTRTLPNGTQWKINGSVSDGAQTKGWYRVSTDEWVAQEDFDFSGKTDVQPKEVNKDDSDDAEEEEDTSVTMSLGQFMSYLTAGTQFSFTVHDDFEFHKFEDYPSGSALDLFLNDGVEAYGYEFTVDNYHIDLYKKIGKDNSFAFVDRGNVSKISTTNDDTTIKTHIQGEFTIDVPSEPDKDSETTEDTSVSNEKDTTQETITAEYTSPHASIYGVIDDDYFTDDSATTKYELLQHMKNKLQDYPLTQITLEYHEFSKSNLFSSINDVEIGNSGYIKDRYDIDIKARIIETTKYYQSSIQHDAEITFGNVVGDFATTVARLNNSSRNGAYKIITN